MQRGEMLSYRSVSNGRRFWFTKPLVMMVVLGLLAVLVGLVMMMQSGWRVTAAVAAQARRAADGVWKATGEAVRERQVGGKLPAQALVWRVEEEALRRVLEQAPAEGREALENSLAVVSLPMPEGKVQQFRVVDSPVLSPQLATQHPQIKSYRGQGVDNPSLTMRCSLTPSGFSALVSDGARTVMIQPLAWFRQAPPRRVDPSQAPSGGSSQSATSGDAMYVSYYGQDYARAAEDAICLVEGDPPSALVQRRAERRARFLAKSQTEVVTIRKYRIAFAVTSEYVTAVGGTGNVVASLSTKLNAVNGYFRDELAVELMLSELAVVYSNDGQPFSNHDPALLKNEARSAFKSLDQSKYDLAHVLGTGNGGDAYVGVVGETLSDSGGPYKAGGATRMSAAGNHAHPTDLMAFMHELGHQFGATHTFNGTNCGTGSGRTGDTAFELGSGLTIMSLGGTCGTDNIVSVRSEFFHSGSLAQITEYLDSFGGTVGTATQTTNHPPTVDAGVDRVIPRLTSFTLSGTVSDPDAGQTLRHTWEQVDAGGTAFANAPYGDQADDPAETTRPLFLPMVPAAAVASGSGVTRTFWGGTPSGFLKGESLPAIGRALNFRLTARDDSSADGGVGSDTMRLEVADNAGPFFVTSPNTAVNWTVNSQEAITWEVNNTNNPPVSCANVDIYFSSDGGASFTKMATVPNTGSATIAVNTPTSEGRIKIEDVDHRFFDISDRNFSVSPVVCTFSLSATNATFTESGGPGSVTVTTGASCMRAAVSQVSWLTVTSGAGGTGTGAVGYTVSQNTGAPRSGTLTIGGRTFTVTQAGPEHGLMFYPLPRPIRLLETRNNPNYPGCFKPNAPVTAGIARTQPARGVCDGLTIPADAVAITGNITVVPTVGAGTLTLYSSDIPRPIVENSNFNQNEVTNNVFTVALGSSDGAFNIYSTVSTDVIVDLTGYYAPISAGGLYFHPLPTPVRLLETRQGFSGCIAPGTPLVGMGDINADPDLDLELQGRSPIPSPCNSIPAGAELLVGNATSVNPSAWGWLTIYPSYPSGAPSRPVIASSNYAGSDIINGPFTVRLGADGKFKVYTYRTTDLVIDILGYFSTEATDTNGAGMLFNPLPKPIRLLETRGNPPNLPGCYKNNGQQIQPGYTNSANHHTQPVWGTCEEVTIPNEALAIVGNATVTNQAAGGFLTFWPGNVVTAPVIATLNHTAQSPQGYNRHFFVGLSPSGQANAGAFKLLSYSATDLRVDVSGYFAP